MSAPARVRPSLGWLGLAVAVAVAGIAGAAILAVLLVRDVDGSFRVLDGPGTVRLDEGEGRGIWALSEEPVSGGCRVAGPARVELKDTNGVTVTSGGREYHSFLRFEAPREGTYRVDCATSRPVALGPYVTGLRLFAGIAGILASLFGGLILAGGIVALILILRERDKRRQETASR